MMLSSKDLDLIRDMAISLLRQSPTSKTLFDMDAPMNEVQQVTFAYLQSVLIYLKRNGMKEEVSIMLKELL